MAIEIVTLTGRFTDGSGGSPYGTLTFTPSVPLTDMTDGTVVPASGVTVTLDSNGSFSLPLYATDNADLAPSGWTWGVTQAIAGLPPSSWSFFLAHADGSTQDISALTPVATATPASAYLPESGGTMSGPIILGGSPPLKLPAGTSGYVLTSDSSGNLTPEAPPASAVTSVNTQTGAVVLAAADVGADASGAAASAQTAAESFAASAVATETSRAETAEALLAPLASPALTGSPTAPTKTALTSNTDVATTAYADAAVGVETSRAETAEALALPKAGGTMSGAIAMGSNKVTGLTNGSGAQDAAAYGQTPAGGNTATVPQGGTGDTSLTAYAPLAGGTTTTGAVQSASTGLATSGNVFTSTGSSSLPSFQALPTASTSTAGIVELDGTAGDIQALASSAAAGSSTKAAAANHVHPTTGLVTGTGDASLVLTGTTLETATLDVIASLHAPAASVGMNSQKLTSLANGSAATDSAAFGQVSALDNVLQPADVGVVAWTVNPSTAVSSVKPSSALVGYLLTWLFKSGPGGTANNINYVVSTVGAGLSDCFLGIYSTGGSLVAQCTTDQSTNMESLNVHAAALSSSYTLAANTLYRVGLVIGAQSTMPTFLASGAANSGSYTNLGIATAADLITGYITGTSTSLPPSFTPSSLTAANIGLTVFVIS